MGQHRLLLSPCRTAHHAQDRHVIQIAQVTGNDARGAEGTEKTEVGTMAHRVVDSAMGDRQAVAIGDRRRGCLSWVGQRPWAVAHG
jgi:hypothetical protein